MSTETANPDPFLVTFFDDNPQLHFLLPQWRDMKWRYFHIGRSLDQPAKRGFPMFAWSTERDSDGKFLSWVWQPTGGEFHRKKTVSHSKRKNAKARALRMRDALLEKTSQ